MLGRAALSSAEDQRGLTVSSFMGAMQPVTDLTDSDLEPKGPKTPRGSSMKRPAASGVSGRGEEPKASKTSEAKAKVHK